MDGIWRLRPNIFHFGPNHAKAKDKNQKMNPDIVPYSHDPPGHTCGLPCCSKDLQVQLRARRQPRSCIGLQEHDDVISQNFTFKGRLKKQPSLQNGFYSVHEQTETKHGDIPVFDSLRNTLPMIKEEKKSYQFLKGRGITLPECNDPNATEKIYLQGFSVGESDDLLDIESCSDIQYYMTVNTGDSCRGVPYPPEGLEPTMLYPWELLKEIKEKAKTGEKGDDTASSNYYEVLNCPEDTKNQIDDGLGKKIMPSDAITPSAPPEPPDVPPRPPKQNMLNHPPLLRDVKDTNQPQPDTNQPKPDTNQPPKPDTNQPKPDLKEMRFPSLEQPSTQTKYNTYNSVHSLNSMANKVSREAYERYQSLNRSQQANKPFHRDARDIDFSGSDNPRVRAREFTSTLERIVQRNDNSTDSLDKDPETNFDNIHKPCIKLTPGSKHHTSNVDPSSKRHLNVAFTMDQHLPNTGCDLETEDAANSNQDKEQLIDENDEEEEGLTNPGFRNVRIEGKILSSRNSLSDNGLYCVRDSVRDGVYHGSLRHGEIDANKLSEVIDAAGVTDADLKYFHVDDIDSGFEVEKGSHNENPITLIL